MSRPRGGKGASPRAAGTALLISTQLFNAPALAQTTQQESDYGRHLVNSILDLEHETSCASICVDILLASSQTGCLGDEQGLEDAHGLGDCAEETSSSPDNGLLTSLEKCLRSHCGTEEMMGLGLNELPAEDETAFDSMKTQHTQYGIVLVLASILLPLLTSLAGHVLRSTPLEAIVLTNVIYPPLWGKRHLLPLPCDAGIVPTRGQALFITGLVLLNLLLAMTGCGYGTVLSSWSLEKSATSLPLTLAAKLLANRLGILSLANIAISVLFAARNNPLVRLTGWSHSSSFLFFHRWTAYICVLQGLIHSGIYLFLAGQRVGSWWGILDNFGRLHWSAGVAAFLILILGLMPSSLLYVRRRWHAIFLDAHIVGVALLLASCFMHVYVRSESRSESVQGQWWWANNWGCEGWVAFATGLWVTERTIRAIKMAHNGVRRAAVSVVDDDYLKVTVPGVQVAVSGQDTAYAFIYFPTLSWRFWESHPFSIASSVLSERTSLGCDKYSEGPSMKRDLRYGHHETPSFGSGTEDTELGREFYREEAFSLHAIRGTMAPKPTYYHGSLIPTPTPQRTTQSPKSASLFTSEAQREGPKSRETSDPDDTIAMASQTAPGLTFFIRRSRGITARLGQTSSSSWLPFSLLPCSYLPVLLETSSKSFPSGSLVACPRLVCIVGGAGVSTILPLLRARSKSTASDATLSCSDNYTSVYWGCRSSSLVRSVGLGEFADEKTNIQVRVGWRWDVEEILMQEAVAATRATNTSSSDNGEITVLVSGPAQMADEVRQAVVEANKQRSFQGEGKGTKERLGVIRLVEECFSW